MTKRRGFFIDVITADFNKLAAGNYDLFIIRNGIQHNRSGGGIVIDDGGCLSTGQLLEELLDALVSL